LSGAPIQFPFNIGEARITGIDAHLLLHPKKKWIQYTSSVSLYYFSDPMAFQLQPERMVRNVITIKNKWFNIDLIHRSESSRQITTVSSSGSIKPNYLEPVTDYDLNLSTHIKYKWIKTILSISGKNLNNQSQELDGISIYDPRYSFNIMFSI